MPLVAKIVRVSADPVGGWASAAAVALAVLLLVWLATTRRVSPARRRWLMALRLGAGLLLLLTWLRPSMVWIEITRRLATLAVLLDSSRSMQVADEAGKRTRWQAAQAALQEAQPALRELAKTVQVKVYTFDDKLRPVPFSDSGLELESTPLGEQTAMGAALDELLKQHAGERLVGLVEDDEVPWRRIEQPAHPSPPLQGVDAGDETVVLGEGVGLAVRDVAFAPKNLES